jgi:hypothetical protein
MPECQQIILLAPIAEGDDTDEAEAEEGTQEDGAPSVIPDTAYDKYDYLWELCGYDEYCDFLDTVFSKTVSL